MIDYLQGRLVDSLPGKVILEIGGTGIQVNVPPSAEPPAGKIGDRVIYYTRLVLRDDELFLYGFENPVKRDMFNLITSVSGFGPKLALSLLGMLPVSQIYWAILGEDTGLLCQVPGIGKKISQRLVLELKDKLPKLMPTGVDKPEAGSSSGVWEEELAEALFSLGYSKLEAAEAINKVQRDGTGDLSREEALRLALQNLGGR